MREEERGPAGKQKPRTVQQRTTRTVPHETTAAQAGVHRLLVPPFAPVGILAFCAFGFLTAEAAS